VRTAGAWVGKGLFIDSYVSRRFPPQVPSKDLFAEYMYWSFQGDVSAENALAAILHPGAIAKEPLCDRIPGLSPDIPLSFVYGQTDWMDRKAAFQLVDSMEGRDVNIQVLDKCGHQLYIEQPLLFTEFLLKNTTKQSNPLHNQPVK